MNASQLALARLAAQRIVQPDFDSAVEVVSWLGAMQAQDYAGALWAIGLRQRNGTLGAVEQAIAQQQIVRTWPLRGTLHFVAAADVRWLLELLAQRTIAASATRSRQLGLDGETFLNSRFVIEAALRDGEPLTRPAVFAVLERAGITTTGQRGYHILWRLAHEGVICFGPHAGKQPTVVLLDGWVAPSATLPREEALAKVAARYFRGHGPATVQDLAWWSGLTLTDARAGLAEAKPGLEEVQCEGTSYWLAPPATAAATSSLALLPGFDEFLLGYRDRGAALEPANAQRVVPGNNGIFMPTIVAGGRVAGLWKRVIGKRGVSVALNPFAPLDEETLHAAQGEAQRYARFLGLSLLR